MKECVDVSLPPAPRDLGIEQWVFVMKVKVTCADQPSHEPRSADANTLYQKWMADFHGREPPCSPARDAWSLERSRKIAEQSNNCQTSIQRDHCRVDAFRFPQTHQRWPSARWISISVLSSLRLSRNPSDRTLLCRT